MKAREKFKWNKFWQNNSKIMSETIIESSSSCRVCLVPEESEKFSSICGICQEEVEAVEKLKMRIFDTHKSYSKMTLIGEQDFLDLIGQQRKKIVPVKKVRLDEVQQKVLTISINQEPADEGFKQQIENINPRKRKLEPELLEVDESKANPDKLSVPRIKKCKKTAATPPIDISKKKKKKFTLRINLVLKPKSNQIVIHKCNDCYEVFSSFEELIDHLIDHDLHEPFACDLCDGIFANEELRAIHKADSHWRQQLESFLKTFCQSYYNLEMK